MHKILQTSPNHIITVNFKPRQVFDEIKNSTLTHAERTTNTSVSCSVSRPHAMTTRRWDEAWEGGLYRGKLSWKWFGWKGGRWLLVSDSIYRLFMTWGQPGWVWVTVSSHYSQKKFEVGWGISVTFSQNWEHNTSKATQYHAWLAPVTISEQHLRHPRLSHFADYFRGKDVSPQNRCRLHWMDRKNGGLEEVCEVHVSCAWLILDLAWMPLWSNAWHGPLVYHLQVGSVFSGKTTQHKASRLVASMELCMMAAAEVLLFWAPKSLAKRAEHWHSLTMQHFAQFLSVHGVS